MKKLRLVLLVVLLFGCKETCQDNVEEPAFSAPDFTLTTLTNETIKLSNLRGE